MEKGTSLDELLDLEWQQVILELIRSGVTKEEFRQFLEEKRKEKSR